MTETREESTLYEQALLLLGAVRLFQHREGRQPTDEDVSAFARLSLEMVHFIARRLEAVGAMEVVVSPFDRKLYIRDHRKVEALAGPDDSPPIEDQAREIDAEKRGRHSEIDANIRPDYVDPEKKDFFSEIEERLKDPGRGKKPNPLDEAFKKG